ncbi:MAG: hypothetical protein ABI131_02495 [Nostocoides sp.]
MHAADYLPLIRVPSSWPFAVTAVAAMVSLAALDLVGAYAAKEWSRRGTPLMLAVGVASFLVLFWVYASALQYAELAIVTLGWIVLLQVGLLLIDRLYYGIHLAPTKWAAIVVILAAQAYLLLPAAGAAGGPQ